LAKNALRIMTLRQVAKLIEGECSEKIRLGTARLDPVRVGALGNPSQLRNFLEDARHHCIPHPNYIFRRTVISLHPRAFHISPYTMLQRTILRASRQQAARQTRAFAPLRQQSPITRAVATPAIRWYSDASSAKESEATQKKEDAPADKNEVSQLKEQIEKKDKEIVELKVRATT
jgi:hypothetical protein